MFQSPVCPSPIVELKQPTVSISISNEQAATSNEIIATVSSETAKNALNIDDTPAIPIVDTLMEMIDDEDFVDTSEDELDDDFENDEMKKPLCLVDRNQLPVDQMEHKTLLAGDVQQPCSSKKTLFSKAGLVKGLSLGNLKFPFCSPTVSPKMKKSKSSSMIVDIEKDDEKRKMLVKGATESFDSSEESDLYFFMDHTKESWHVDVSNINYFLNQTGMQEQHQGIRNSMSPITKSTQRMPKSMQESIMTPRSRKPVMISMFGNNSDKTYQTNISQLLEETEEMPSESIQSESTTSKESSSGSCGSIPLNDIAAANDNGLPVVEDNGGYSNAFK